MEAPAWDGEPVWIHADLLRPNVLVDEGGRIAAVIDFGSVGAGDPAADASRLGRSSSAPDATRTCPLWTSMLACASVPVAIALHQAAMIIPYYASTNPGFVVHARRTVEQVLM